MGASARLLRPGPSSERIVAAWVHVAWTATSALWTRSRRDEMVPPAAAPRPAGLVDRETSGPSRSSRFQVVSNDDRLPSGAFSVTWSKLDGPGEVTFGATLAVKPG